MGDDVTARCSIMKECYGATVDYQVPDLYGPLFFTQPMLRLSPKNTLNLNALSASCTSLATVAFYNHWIAFGGGSSTRLDHG